MAKPRRIIQPKPRSGDSPAKKPVAIIDIGSNSVRLVVFEGASLTPIPLFNEKCLCGLGREVSSTGMLAANAVERALMALRRFRSIVDQIGVRDVRVIATAAAREAKNGEAFIEAAEKICGAKIEVISGVKEAELAAAGVLAGDKDADGLAGDLGGGSLEIINIKSQALSDGITLPLGGLRLIDDAKGDLGRARRLIDKSLKSVDWIEKGRGRSFHLVGGTWRAFVKMHMASIDYPLRVLHGYTIDAAEAQKFAKHLIKQDELKDLPGAQSVSKQRRFVLPFGALVLERIIDIIEPSDIVTSNYGVREGMLYSLLGAAPRKRDPLLAACEDLARLRSRSARHALELCDWTDQLYTIPSLKESSEQRRLRHAACLISDIGWRTHPSFRAERTMDSVAYSIFSSIDHVGRAFLALSSYFRNEGPSADASNIQLSKLLSERDLNRARIIAAAIRIAHVVSAGVPKIVPKTPLSFEGEKLILKLPHPFDALDGERLARRFANLGRLFDMETEIRVNSDSRFFKFLDLRRPT